MNDQQLKAALEKFEALLKRQAQRVENMKQQGDFIDFEALPENNNRRLRRGRIGPVITNEARRVLEFLLQNDVDAGKIEFRTIDGLTIENRAAVGKASGRRAG